MTRACTDCGLLHPAGTPCFSISLPISGQQALADGAMLASRYRILHTIHRGGMSVVYLAEDTVQDRQVAIKELRLPEGASAEELAEAEAWFARESYLLSVPLAFRSFRASTACSASTIAAISCRNIWKGRTSSA